MQEISLDDMNGHLRPLDDWLTQSDQFGDLPAHLNVRRGAGFRKSASIASPLPSAKGTSVNYRRAINATIWSFVVTIIFAGGVVYPWKGTQATIDFTTAFLVEKSLSVDNLFVFLMIFEYFKVPDDHVQRVLSWGIIGALVFRGIMIGVGVAVVTRFRPVLLVFALILVWSAYKMLQAEDEAESLADNPVMKLARRVVSATDTYDGDRFFTRVGGKRRATPMLVVLICIELSDVVFAIDSIPAVVGISQDPFVVYTSNCFALLALRSLYVLLAKSVQQLHYLRHAVALILGFVGCKMTLEFFHVEIGSTISLGVIVLLLAGGTALSIVKNRQDALNGGTDEHKSEV
tara:strand:+ start:549 stop:1586 length:1038 start_codon:yes stop_codon:yes gene_type:complete